MSNLAFSAEFLWGILLGIGVGAAISVGVDAVMGR